MARRPFVRSVRRSTDWSASALRTGTTSVGASSATLLEVFIPAVGGETIVRTRGLFTIATDQFTANELQLGAVGIAKVTQQAQSIGISAIPHPATDAAWGGWLFHSFFSYEFAFISAVGMDPNVTHPIVVDSKAMRKVDEDERLVVVVENSGSFGFDVYSSFRFLSKLH